MFNTCRQLIKYMHEDPSVLDERPAFDRDISEAYFHQGGPVGCIVLHGIGGTPANVRVISDALAARGYTVISPVLPGHRDTVRALNASTGDQWLSCAQAAYDRLKEAGCTQIFALGLSLGGILSGLLATQAEQRPLSGLVMICAPVEMMPFLRLGRRLRRLVPFIRFPEEGRAKVYTADPIYGQMYDGFSTLKLQDLYLLCRQLRRDLYKIRCPVLSISAEYDNKVDPASKAIFEKGAVNAQSIEYFHLKNSPHGCTYGPEKALVADTAAAFVERIAGAK